MDRTIIDSSTERLVISVAHGLRRKTTPRRRRRLVAILGCLAVLFTGVGATYAAFHESAPTYRLFDGGVPGQRDANEALEFAHKSGIQQVINYSFINGTTADEQAYLALASRLHVQVVVSLSDLLGNSPRLLHSPSIDQDPGDLAMHARFGRTHAQQVAGVIKMFGNNPAVGGWYITDELPAQQANPDGMTTWRKPLMQLYTEVKSLSDKPIMGAFTNNPPSFYRQVDVAPGFAMGVDYYPYPDNVPQNYGNQTAIPGIAQSIASVNGQNSWFVVQGMSWDTEGGHAAFNFPVHSPAPPAAWMAGVMENVMYKGVRNIGIYMYSDAAQTPGQLQQIKIAVASAKAWWNSQHPLGLVF